MKPQVWISRGKFMPVEGITKVYEKEGNVLFLDNDGREHQSYRPEISYINDEGPVMERGENSEPQVRVTYCKPPSPKLPAAVKSVFEKHWKERGVSASIFEMAGLINHLIRDGKKRKELALAFIRMKKDETKSSRKEIIIPPSEEEIREEMNTLAILLSLRLKGLKFHLKK